MRTCMGRGGPSRPRLAPALALLAALGSTLALSGCADPNEGGPSPSPSPSPTPDPPAEDCDIAAPLPTAPTWAAHGGTWGTFVQPEPAHPQGIRGAGGAEEPGLSLLIDHGTPASASVDAMVRFALVAGEHPDGAGLAFHWAGASYNIVRYSPSEGGWHLFTVIDGDRTKANTTVAATTPPGPGWCDWTSLRVAADGPDVEAWQDGSLVLRATLPDGASTSGQAGLFLRGGTVALFDGYARS